VSVPGQIAAYIASQPEPKGAELQALHELVLGIAPDSKLWFLDGKDASGKVVSNPNIGYGSQTIDYANGKSREFYKIGLSANTTGISVYVMGLKDKNLLANRFGDRIGKASVSGYCVKFRTLQDVNAEALEDVIRFGLEDSSPLMGEG